MAVLDEQVGQHGRRARWRPAIVIHSTSPSSRIIDREAGPPARQQAVEPSAPTPAASTRRSARHRCARDPRGLGVDVLDPAVVEVLRPGPSAAARPRPEQLVAGRGAGSPPWRLTRAPGGGVIGRPARRARPCCTASMTCRSPSSSRSAIHARWARRGTSLDHAVEPRRTASAQAGRVVAQAARAADDLARRDVVRSAAAVGDALALPRRRGHDRHAEIARELRASTSMPCARASSIRFSRPPRGR